MVVVESEEEEGGGEEVEGGGLCGVGKSTPRGPGEPGPYKAEKRLADSPRARFIRAPTNQRLRAPE